MDLYSIKYKILLVGLFFCISTMLSAQVENSDYIVTISNSAKVEESNTNKQDRIKRDSIPKRERKKWEKYMDTMYKHLHDGRQESEIPHIGELYFFNKTPFRKNRIIVNMPFRIDRSVLMMWEWNPTYERDVLGWLSLHAGPTFYRRKLFAHYRGYPGKPAWFTIGDNVYWIDGWGQNLGIKVFSHYNAQPDIRVGLSLTYQQRKIRLYGPISDFDGVVEGLEAITAVYQDYFISVVDKTVEDGRIRTLVYGEWLVGNAFIVNIYGGMGLPLWGRFRNKVLGTSGSRRDEWNDGKRNNIIMMRNYDLYLGASAGFYFGRNKGTNNYESKNKKNRKKHFESEIGHTYNIFLSKNKYLLTKSPIRKNRIKVAFPFVFENHLRSRKEWNFTFERDVAGWLGIIAGPTFYSRRITAYPFGFNDGQISTDFNKYYLTGWGQNIGINLFLHESGDFTEKTHRFGASIIYSRRQMNIFGPSNFSDGVIYTDDGTPYSRIGPIIQANGTYYSPEEYKLLIVNKTVNDQRLKFLAYVETIHSNRISIRWFGGYGIGLRGNFVDRVNGTSGGIEEERKSESNNIIVLNKSYIHFGLEMGYLFGGNRKKQI